MTNGVESFDSLAVSIIYQKGVTLGQLSGSSINTYQGYEERYGLSSDSTCNGEGLCIISYFKLFEMM